MNIKIYILGLLIATLALSCNDYLDLKPISQQTSNNAYETGDHLEAALTGVYNTFQSSDYYVFNFLIFEDIRSDNYYAGGDNPEMFEADYLNISASNSKVNNVWANLYNAIAKANTVLQKIELVEDPKLTDERRNQIKGEALFLRAYHYYQLVKLFGGVPLVLEPVSDASPEVVNVSRATDVEVYTQILADLDLAITLLPDTYGSDPSVNKARATAGAANAVAAKVCMQKPNPDYAKALEYIAAVESSDANYKLIDYAQLFDGNHHNNDESIMEIQFLGGGADANGNWGPPMCLGTDWRKFCTPSHSLVDAFDAESDVVRKNASILFDTPGWPDEFWGNVGGSSIPFAYKWKDASSWQSPDRTYIVRLGDIVLLKAEALNESGKLASAIIEVNKIRSRANLPDLTTEQSSSKEVMKETILNERRLELAQEGQRWDDLVRNGVAVSTMNNLVEIDLRTGSAVKYNMTAAKILLPIPQEELDRNPALVQNPL